MQAPLGLVSASLGKRPQLLAIPIIAGWIDIENINPAHSASCKSNKRPAFGVRATPCRLKATIDKWLLVQCTRKDWEVRRQHHTNRLLRLLGDTRRREV